MEKLHGNNRIIFTPKHPCIGAAYYLEGQKYRSLPKKALELHEKGLKLRKKTRQNAEYKQTFDGKTKQ